MKRLAMLMSLAFLALGCDRVEEVVKPVTGDVDLSDPRSVASALSEKRLSEEQVLEVCSQEVDFQLEIAQELFRVDGKSSSEIDILVRGLRTELTDRPENEGTSHAGTFATAGACDQWVEHKTVVRDPVWAQYTTSFTSSRGREYVYYFSPWWTVDSDNIRWGASDPRVFWALYLRNWGKLWGFHLCSKPYQILIGDSIVAAAGGQYWVMANLYIHHL